jgi:hypothetical protein
MADRSVTLTWQEPLTSIREYQPKDTWIFDLVWEEMTEDAGLYVIEDSAGDCLYAGQAIRSRAFDAATSPSANSDCCRPRTPLKATR